MPVAMRALSCRALALALVAMASSSRAEEPTSARVWLDWSQGGGTVAFCPEEVVRDVEQLLGRRLLVRGQSSMGRSMST